MGKDQRVWICDGATGSVRGHTPALPGVALAKQLVFSPDGKTFFTGLSNGEARLWAVATLTPLGDAIPHPGSATPGDVQPRRQIDLGDL